MYISKTEEKEPMRLKMLEKEKTELREKEARRIAGNGLTGEQGKGVSSRNKQDHILLKAEERKGDKKNNVECKRRKMCKPISDALNFLSIVEK